MRLSWISTLSLLGTCTAQRWRLQGCGNFDQDEIRSAIKDSITMAETALDVLNNNYGDQKVQSMVKYMLGTDQTLPAKVDKAKQIFEGIARYDKNENTFFGPPLTTNQDVMIWCDMSNYNMGQPIWNIAMGIPMPGPYRGTIQQCFNTIPGPGINSLPMAMTLSSDDVNATSYGPLYRAWVNAGRQGPRPDPEPHALPRIDKTNTMDLCTWYLNRLGHGGFASINDATIARVQEQSFLSGLSGSNKAIDALTESLTGTFLHELSHTNLGGKTQDNEAAGGCYGWVCVGAIHEPNNADTINHLGVAMHLFKKGFWVTNEGKVAKI